jgi:hypothetical protein
MVASSLDESAGAYVKSASYHRLDPSEKSAVSYFLGMAQAKVTCARLLGISHLVHLDLLLARVGRRTRRTRPDFIGFDLTTRTLSAAVEAKGRTHYWTDYLMNQAKNQARQLPFITGIPNTIEVASASWFDTDDSWNAHLVDPPRKRGGQDEYTQGDVLAAYYQPVVEALRSAERANLADAAPSMRSLLGGIPMLVGRIPDCDLVVGIPSDIAGSVTEQVSQPTTPLSKSERDSTSERRLVDAAAQSLAVLGEVTSQLATDSTSAYVGKDGVLVALGASWQR